MKLFAALLCVTAAIAIAGGALGQEPAPSADQLLSDARVASYRFRTGRYELAAPSVAALEAGARAHPEDPRVWNALGVAYFQQMTAAMANGGFRELPGLIVKARDAHARALALAPDDPLALSGHGAALTIMSRFTNQPELGRQGMAEMDRATALGPDVTVVRLQRGFTHLGVPAEMRSDAAVEADLSHLLRTADGRRTGDVLHVLLGDLYVEQGRKDLAKAHYAAAARPASPVRGLGEGRLEALAAGVPYPADIARLRGETARNCALCHGG